MKKLVLTLAIVLGMTVTAFAGGGGLFNRGVSSEETGYEYGLMNRNVRNGSDVPVIPNHEQSDNQNAPLGSGIAVLVGLGAAYALRKKTGDRR